ncbi:hypothetical protein LOAG_16012 [Loa loa]|uniref:Uncharacterized protein n=1 Tax=Loa loa TaxID=7209 RepID=A0A1S0TEG5_LOALO|nr:hypothetical protein LOAG_16012 [Loa loa]EFO12521.1 hypothetical protein LOAG_16012 [Loa loa]
MNDDLDIDKMGRYWSETKKKRRPFRQKDSGTENNNEDSIGLGEQAMNLSSPRGESPSQPSSPAHIDTKTALRAPSMESMLPDDDDVDDIKPPVNYKAMFEGASEPKYTDMELFVELRYWIVLALFIFLLIIYRSFLSSAPM